MEMTHVWFQCYLSLTCMHCQAARLVCKLNWSLYLTMAKFERWKSSSCKVPVFLVSCFIGCFRNLRLPFWQFYWLYTSFMFSEKSRVFIGEICGTFVISVILLMDRRDVPQGDILLFRHNLIFVSGAPPLLLVRIL